MDKQKGQGHLLTGAQKPTDADPEIQTDAEIESEIENDRQTCMRTGTHTRIIAVR